MSKLGKAKILVIGDLILDVYHQGKYIGQSVSDGKTPVALAESTKSMWGGAGLLVRNMLALGSSVSFISIIGKDEYSVKANAFTHARLKKIFFTIPSRHTTVKERFWMGDRKLLGWYRFDNTPLPHNVENNIMRKVRSEMRFAGKVIVADYRHGLLSPSLARNIVRECARQKIPLYIDSQIAHSKGNHAWYKGANLFCLNQKEAESVDKKFDMKNLNASLKRIQKILHAQNIIIKLGRRGSAALLSGEYIETKMHRVKTVDTSGAGDAFLGCLVVGNNSLTVHDLHRANIWAALSTATIGTEILPVTKFRKVLTKS